MVPLPSDSTADSWQRWLSTGLSNASSSCHPGHHDGSCGHLRLCGLHCPPSSCPLSSVAPGTPTPADPPPSSLLGPHGDLGATPEPKGKGNTWSLEPRLQEKGRRLAQEFCIFIFKNIALDNYLSPDRHLGEPLQVLHRRQAPHGLLNSGLEELFR